MADGSLHDRGLVAVLVVRRRAALGQDRFDALARLADHVADLLHLVRVGRIGPHGVAQRARQLAGLAAHRAHLLAEMLALQPGPPARVVGPFLALLDKGIPGVGQPVGALAVDRRGRHQPLILQHLQRRVDRAGAGAIQTTGALLKLFDHVVAVARSLAQQVKQHILHIAAVELAAMWFFKSGESPPKTRHCTLLVLIRFTHTVLAVLLTIRFTVLAVLVTPARGRGPSPAAKVMEAPRVTPPPPCTEALDGALEGGARHGSGYEVLPGFAAPERAEGPERPKRAKQPEEAAKRRTFNWPVPAACVAVPPSVGEHSRPPFAASR